MISRRSLLSTSAAVGAVGALSIGAAGTGQAATTSPLHRRNPKDVSRGFYESFNQKDMDASFARYISLDLVNHALGGAYDRAAWLGFEKAWFPAFADFRLTVLDQIAEGDKVSTRFQLGGTQTGDYLGIPASGNTAFLSATAVDRIAHGQIVEHWADMDFQGFLQKLSAPHTSA